jgi:hypothetical protein
MKEDLLPQFRGSPAQRKAKNQMREYLQARMLTSLQRSGAMVPLAFQVERRSSIGQMLSTSS